MCGIAGIFRADKGTVNELHLAQVKRMVSHLEVRGPDDQGISRGGSSVLGHRRLAILDLSAAGHQPMRLTNGPTEVVYNGEIYNFRELRRELQQHDCAFRSESDTEVLLHGERVWGLDGLLERVRGMYAFALVNHETGRIVLARDPMGKKPLFYAVGEGTLYFASSALALNKALPWSPAVSLEALDDYLTNFYVPGPRSIFGDVKVLLPGHYLTFDGTIDTRRHWQCDFVHPEEGIGMSSWIERLEADLERAVRRRLVSDVPVGVLLSGGVDSGLVTAFAAKAGPTKTFSVASDVPELDESSLAKLVAQRYGTDHQVLHVGSDFCPYFDDLVAAMGTPLGDPSAANMLSIARLAKGSVGVVLTGDGGDELFGGYSSFHALFLGGLIAATVPTPLHRTAAVLGEMLSKYRGPVRSAGTLLSYALSPVEITMERRGWLSSELRRELFTPEVHVALAGRSPLRHYHEKIHGLPRRASNVNRGMQCHFETILPDDYLAKVDAGTMGVSLEARCPLLDRDLVETAMRMPARVRFRLGQRKGLLRHIARRHLPPEILRARKRGFVAPVGKWLRDHAWRKLIDEYVLGPCVEQRGWFRRDTLSRVVEEHQHSGNQGYLLWRLMVLERWLQLAAQPGDSRGEAAAPN